jgi:hypothetical protein
MLIFFILYWAKNFVFCPPAHGNINVTKCFDFGFFKNGFPTFQTYFCFSVVDSYMVYKALDRVTLFPVFRILKIRLDALFN